MTNDQRAFAILTIRDGDHGDHPVRGRLVSRPFLRAETGTTHLAPGRVGGNGCHVLNAANAHARTSERTESALCTGTGGLGASTTSSTELDVEGGDADLTAAGGDVLSSQHGGVGRRLVAIGLDLHAAGDARDRLLAGQIGDVHESVVEGRKDVRNDEVTLALGKLGAELDGLLLLNAGFLGRLEAHPSVSDAIQPLNIAQIGSKRRDPVQHSIKDSPC